MTVIYAIILFVLLIFPHELGHFIVAKAVGVKVNEFAFGMGPALFKRQKGETLYAVRLIPIGGYCAMEGENEESDDSRSFNNKPGWAKISVLLAGSAMNVLIAVLTLSILMGVIGSATTAVDQVQADSPAYRAGLEKGDKIIAVDGEEIDSWQELTEVIGGSSQTRSVTFERGWSGADRGYHPCGRRGRQIYRRHYISGQSQRLYCGKKRLKSHVEYDGAHV